MIREKVLNTIREKNLIEKNQHIVIGLSGGPDSVCLFHLLLGISKEWNLTLHPVHINHKFRPGAAEEDQAYVEALSLKAGCPCQTFIYDCNQIAEQEKITSEEAGRKVRYEAFAKVADDIEASGVNKQDIRIAVAQNADDQAETILFRILRGAGVDGLSGIAYSRKDDHGNLIVRPLLDISKEEIRNYCEEQNLNPRIDKTNLEPIYTRNRIRLQLIPYLQKEYNPSITESLIRTGKSAAMDRDFLEGEAGQAFDRTIRTQNPDSLTFDGDQLRQLHRSIRQRVLAMAFRKLGLYGDLTFVHFDSCEDIVFNDKPSARVNLPGGYYLAKVYGDVKAGLESKDAFTSKPSRAVSILTAEEFKKAELTRDSHCAFDLDELKECYGENAADLIELRTRTEGDYIAIGEGKTKKLQNFFVDNKVPKDLRDEVWLIAIGNEILWILPHNGQKGRYSYKYKLCNATKNIICVEINCEI